MASRRFASGHLGSRPVRTKRIFDIEEVKEDWRESVENILCMSHTEKWMESGLGALVPESMYGRDTHIQQASLSPFSSFNVRPVADQFLDLWNLHLDDFQREISETFTTKLVNPRLDDQLNHMIELFPFRNRNSYLNDISERETTAVSRHAITWIDVRIQDGALHHAGTNAMGERLQQYEERTENSAPIEKLATYFLVDYQFLDRKADQELYQRRYDSLIKGLRYGLVREIIKVMVCRSIENEVRDQTEGLPVGRNELNQRILRYFSEKLVCNKDHNLNFEVVERLLAPKLDRTCQLPPNFYLLDQSIPVQHRLRVDALTAGGAQDPVRRNQSLDTTAEVFGGHTFSPIEKALVLPCPGIPDQYLGITEHHMRREMRCGQYVLMTPHASERTSGDTHYQTMHRDIYMIDGDRNTETPVHFMEAVRNSGMFDEDGHNTHFAVALLETLRHYQPTDRTFGVSSFGSQRALGWIDSAQGKPGPLGRCADILQQDRPVGTVRQELDDAVAFHELPEEHNLKNLFAAAGTLEVARRKMTQLGFNGIQGLDEANHHAEMGQPLGSISGGGGGGGGGAGPRGPHRTFPVLPTAMVLLEYHAGLVFHVPAKRYVANGYFPSAGANSRYSAATFIEPSYLGAVTALVRSTCAAVIGNSTEDAVFHLLRTLARAFYTKTPDQKQDFVNKWAPLLFLGTSRDPEQDADGSFAQGKADLRAFLGAYSGAVVNAARLNDAGVGDLFDRKYFVQEVNPADLGINAILAAIVGVNKQAQLLELTGDDKTSLKFFCHYARCYRAHPQTAEAFSHVVNNVVDALNDGKLELIPEFKKYGIDLSTDGQASATVLPANLAKLFQSPWAKPKRGGAGAEGDGKAGTGPLSIDQVEKRLQYKLTWPVVQWLGASNFPLPFGCVLAQLDIRITTGAVIAGRKKTAINTYVEDGGLNVTTVPENCALQISAHMRYAVMARKPEQLAILPDAIAIEYRGGLSTRFMRTDHKTRTAYAQGGLVDKSGLIAMIVPPAWLPTGTILEVLGQPHPELVTHDQMAEPDYPTAPLYRTFYGDFGIQDTHIWSPDYILNPQGRIGTLFPGAYRKFDGLNSWKMEKGVGPLGEEMRACNFSVLSGRGMTGRNLQGNP